VPSGNDVKGETPIDCVRFYGCFSVAVYKNSQEERAVTARNSVSVWRGMADFLGKMNFGRCFFSQQQREQRTE
jgi:hypothetical protein